MLNETGEYIIAVTTCDNRDKAMEIAAMLVQEHLAACVQMFAAQSVYDWQGEVRSADEYVLFAKTRLELFERLTDAVRKNHDYEVPEIIHIPIGGGLPEYLAWVSASTFRRT